MTTSTLQLALYGLLVALPIVFFARRTFTSSIPAAASEEKKNEEPKSIMQPARDDLQPPKDDPITLEELKQYNGSDPLKPIYVAIKGA